MWVAGRLVSGVGITAAAMVTLTGFSGSGATCLGTTRSLLAMPAGLGACEARVAREGVRCLGLWAQGSVGDLLAVSSSRDACERSEPRSLLAAAHGGTGMKLARASSAAAPEKLTAAWLQLAPGVQLRTLTISPGVTMHQVLCDPKQAGFSLVSARKLGLSAAPVSELARTAHALVAVNACYFGQQREPLGYLKVQGRVVEPRVATGSAFTGLLTLRRGEARIVAREDFRPARIDEALQAGPRLVVDGKPTQGLLERRSFRQSGVGVTRSGRILLYATDGSYKGCTWQQVQRVLLSETARKELDLKDVLNLDGGSSSQFYTAPPTALRTGFPTPVPVALAVFRQAVPIR